MRGRLVLAAVVLMAVALALLWSPCPEPVPKGPATTVTVDYLPPER
jgi:hypothetical protein